MKKLVLCLLCLGVPASLLYAQKIIEKTLPYSANQKIELELKIAENIKINTWDKISSRLVRKNSLPFDRNKPHQPHNFMHNKLVIADDVVVTGSFNLSNHAMGNAENVLLIPDAGIASKYEAYIQQVMTRYGR